MRDNILIFIKEHKALVGFIGVILALVIIVNVFSLLHNKGDRLFDTPQTSMLAIPEPTPEDFFGDELSDIDGMTKVEKVNMGLNPEDGSDTDSDGLSDKIEIEILGSDPLAFSTSGDLISDGEKVHLKLDLFTKYDDYEYTMENCTAPDVIATPSDAYSVYASIHGDAIWHEIENVTVLREIFVSGFSGTIKVDVSSILKENDLDDADDLVCYLSSSKEDLVTPTKCSYEAKDKTISIKDIFSEQYNYYIVIGKKVSFSEAFINHFHKKDEKISDAGSFVSDTANALSNALNNSEDDNSYNYCGVVRFNIFGNYFFNMQPVIYYKELPTKEATEAEKKELFKLFLTTVMNEDFGPIVYSDETFPYEDVEFKALSKEDIDSKIGIYSQFPEDFHWALWDKNPDVTFSGALFGWVSYKDLPKFSLATQYTAKETEDGKKTEETLGAFDINTEILPFSNFGSYISPGGNCSGIARYTMLLHNYGTIKSTGSINTTIYDFAKAKKKLIANEDYRTVSCKKETINWKISGKKNQTLLDSGLSDFRSKDWIKKNHTKGYDTLIDNSKLSNADKQFVDLIGGYWQYQNNLLELEWAASNAIYDSAAKMKEITSILDQNKIICCTLFLVQETDDKDALVPIPLGYHTVNVIGYKKLGAYGYRFYVYDNNNPMSSPCINEYHSYIDCCILDDDTLIYSYNPTNIDYCSTNLRIYNAGSDELMMTKSFIDFSDANGNSLHTCSGEMNNRVLWRFDHTDLDYYLEKMNEDGKVDKKEE